MSAERERGDGFGGLEDGLRQASAWYLWGPFVRAGRGGGAAGQRLIPVGTLRQRAAVGDSPGGLQRGRRGVGLPAARSRQVPGLPLGRGRPGRLLRRGAAAVPGAGPVERP